MFVRGKPTNAFFKIDKLCNNIEVLKKIKIPQKFKCYRNKDDAHDQWKVVCV